jgi:hypothetical protein
LKTLLISVLALAACGHPPAFRELVALKAEGAQYDGALGGAYAERARLELAKARDLGAYHAAMDGWNVRVDRMAGLVTALNRAAHEAGLLILQEQPGDHLKEVRAIVCEMAKLVRDVTQVHAVGPMPRECRP